MIKHYKSPLLSIKSSFSNNYQYESIQADTMINYCYGSRDDSKYNYFPVFQNAYNTVGDNSPIFSCSNYYVDGKWIDSYIHSSENLNDSIYGEWLVIRIHK